MRKLSRLVLMLMAISIFMFVISACQQSNLEAPKENDGAQKDNGQEQAGEDKTPEEGSGKPEADSEAPNNDAGETQETSNDKSEKLGINPTVSIKENYDYIKLDKPSVDFELKDLNGNVVKLSDYKGQIVFLNFWATWCPPCREEMPDMESIHQQYDDNGVAILGVSSTEIELRGGSDEKKAEKQVKEYIDKEGFTFTIPLDTDSKVLGEYNSIYPVTGIPTTFMIDREGVIRYARPGAFQGEEQLKAFIALLDQ